MAKRVKSDSKVIALLSWDSKGIKLSNYLQQRKVNNEAHNVKMFERLVIAIREKSSRLNEKKFFTLEDNASPQTCKFSMAEFKDLRLELLLHPPNSTD
jgi:hypothetical protein